MNEGKIIFLIENSTEYVFQLEQGFRKADLRNRIQVARYGNEAILYLKGIGVYGDRSRYPLPHLIILDMTIPDGSPMSVLGWIRSQEQFQLIPIIVLVHPTQNNLAQLAFDKGANACFTKRENLQGLVNMIQELEMIGEDHPSTILAPISG